MSQANQTPKHSHDENFSQDLINVFIQAVSYLLLPNEYKGTALYKYLVQIAKAYHLPINEIDAILNEGIKRGIDYIRKNREPIRNPEAWLRPVCLNIMRDRVNANVRHEQKAQRVSEIILPLKNPLAETELLEQLEYLDQALTELSESDQLLIRMKFWQGKTYEQIQYHYKLMSEGSTEKEPVPSIPALRKRESRALEKLRKIFFSIYEEAPKKSS